MVATAIHHNRRESCMILFLMLQSNKELNRQVATTYAAQSTCPATCPFLHCGCYAETGVHTKAIQNRLDNTCTPYNSAVQESLDIILSPALHPLRLHTAGDCYDTPSAKVIARAAQHYTSKHGQPVWTYTHNHRIKREAWGIISVLRSCETVRQCVRSARVGFASALVVKDFKQDKAYDLGHGLKGIPCPAQTGRAASCVACGLCLNADRLHRTNCVILLKVHGSGLSRAMKALGG